MEKFSQYKTSVYAYSTDSIEETKEIVERNELTLPILCEVNGPEMSEKLGVYYEESRNILHTNSYILKVDKVLSLTISNGPIGRITAVDAFAFIRFLQKREETSAD